ncbi:dTDP-4-dehydrorhamnose reductase [Saccharicrinis fermentans]|uniref:dTDP-4-dehydrorhamnose reductase n=1 Tax=Saccharicrinis fermentans DSM 9555 = JCM 21142 TaxID=869213 RepID=W7Y269_9BACT|nr:dTDP-4-dehydrorhamnose reductase [Saccharicrinis fermentans]GAF02042.1 dTDP-4-dehydrorhamnose reductase [Saccharicrinis fermentans DSM 9555 = JCM 21142]
MMNILVTGANGQLGSELKLQAGDYPHCKFFFTDVKELDICNIQDVLTYVRSNDIDLIINCAAYTAVDKAETDIEKARLINVEAVKNLVKACESEKAKLIHVSTDYVYNGEYYKPLSEDMKVSPIGVYGVTKQEGEEVVIKAGIESIVIRTSWLYSSYGNNFVKTMMRLGAERDDLGVIFDQVGTPTYACDLARVILQIMNREGRLDAAGKIYHFSNEGVASWYDFAKEIMDCAGIVCEVRPIKTEDYPTPAQRPHYSVLDKTKIKCDFRIEIPYWKDSLKKCIELMSKR